MKNNQVNRAVFLMLICLFTMGLNSCSKKVIPLGGYAEISQRKDVLYIDSLTITPRDEIRLNIAKGRELNLSDPTLWYGDSVYSNYKTFSFKADSTKKYKINIWSQCDCLGFKKYMMNPEIKVQSNSGQSIDVRTDTCFFDDKDSFTLTKVWNIGPKINDGCNILLFANNEALQQEVFNSNLSTYIYTGSFSMPVNLPISVKSSLVGEFIIQILEE